MLSAFVMLLVLQRLLSLQGLQELDLQMVAIHTSGQAG